MAGDPGWRIVLAHLNAHKPAVQQLAAYLSEQQPDLDARRAKRLAEKARKGQPILPGDFGTLPEEQTTVLLRLFDAVCRSYAVPEDPQADVRRDIERLRLHIPAADRDRLKALREMGNGRALSPADLKLAQLRTRETIEAWLAMGRRERFAWYTRVEAALLAKDKARAKDEPPLITSSYRRAYLSARRIVANTADYSLLGLNPDADAAAIKRAYRKAALRHHPDQQGDAAVFRKVHAAYQRLLSVEELP